MDTLREWVAAAPGRKRATAQDLLILDASEALARQLKRQKLTKAGLARRHGSTTGFITQVLAGHANLSLRTLADLARALGYEVHITLRPTRPLLRES